MPRLGASPSLLAWLFLLTPCLFLGSTHSSTADWLPLNHGIPITSVGAFALGDADNDGDLDLALVGKSESGEQQAAIHLNDGRGTFDAGGIPFQGVSTGAVAWADYDRDGDLDLVVTGLDTSVANPGVGVTRLYRNDRGVLLDSGLPLPAIAGLAVAWGDFDNDGAPDLVLAGNLTDDQPVAHLLWNRPTGFVDSRIVLPGLFRGATLAPADADNDGDLDLLLGPMEFSEAGLPSFGSALLVNQGNGSFTTLRLSSSIDVGFASQWADFNLDGFWDISIAGGSRWTSLVFQPDSATYARDTASSLTSLSETQLACGDYNRDGRPDAVAVGFQISLTRPRTILARNAPFTTGFRLIAEASGIANVGAFRQGGVGFGDLDADGDLDLLEFGRSEALIPSFSAFENSLPGQFAAPTPPESLRESTFDGGALLEWSAPTNATTFNIRIGTRPGGIDIVSPLADTTSGRRRVPAPGNAGLARRFPISALPPGRYYWSVQSVDPAFNGSPFTPERSFTIGATTPPPRMEIAPAPDVAPGSVAVRIAETNGRQIILQHSPDLRQWIDYGVPAAGDRTLTVPIHAAPGGFFRARVIP